MNIDDIWSEIKNDKTKIYGNQTVFDVFLSTTDDLKPEHFLELSPSDVNKLSGGAVADVLARSKDKTKVAEILGKENINKLSDNDISDIMWRVSPLSGEFSPPSDELAKIIIQNKREITSNNIIALMSYCSDKYEIAKMIINYKKELSDSDIRHLMIFKDKREELIALVAKNKIKLDSDGVWLLLAMSGDKKEIAKILGKENIDKLSDRDLARFELKDHYGQS